MQKGQVVKSLSFFFWKASPQTHNDLTSSTHWLPKPELADLGPAAWRFTRDLASDLSIDSTFVPSLKPAAKLPKDLRSAGSVMALPLGFIRHFSDNSRAALCIFMLIGQRGPILGQ